MTMTPPRWIGDYPWLVLMSVLGGLTVVLFGFCPWIPTVFGMADNWGCRSRWESWELGALIWSLLFAFYYYFSFRNTNHHRIDKIVGLLFSVGTAVPATIAIYSLVVSHNAWFHVGAVVAISFVFLLADCLLARHHADAKERGEFGECVLLADMPTVLASGLLAAYVAFNHDNPEWEVFFAGAVTFQLLSSNVLFVITQAGLIRKVWSSQQIRE